MSSGPKREHIVRVPKNQSKRYTILKFNASLNVRPQEWINSTLRLERENNRREGVTVSGEVLQDYGEGSVYGKAVREEARRKKYGRQSKAYQHDKQPWNMSIEVPEGAEEGTSNGGKLAGKGRKFRSIRDGAGEHADYWIFYKVGNDLEAYKVLDWYQFLPAVTYKYLDADQAEERFKTRDKVFNQFALKAQIKKQLAEQEEIQQQDMKKSFLKIKDEMSSDDEENEDLDGPKNQREGKGEKDKKKKKPQQLNREKKKQRVKNSEDVAAYESDDGDDEGREYDYISDSGSDTDREELNVDKKMEEDLVGVDEEKGLKSDLESEGEEEEAEEEKKGTEKKEEELADEEEEEKKYAEQGVRSKAVRNVDAIMAQKAGAKMAMELDASKDDHDSSYSDSDEDPDSGRVKSVLFIQDKRKAGTSSSQQRKRGLTDDKAGSASSADFDVKRAKPSESQPSDLKEKPDSGTIEISEIFIRKLLEKKPHSTKQLLTKVNQRQQQERGGDQLGEKDKKTIVSKLAEILKKIEPYQFRKRDERGKDTLFFSLNRTA